MPNYENSKLKKFQILEILNYKNYKLQIFLIRNSKL